MIMFLIFEKFKCTLSWVVFQQRLQSPIHIAAEQGYSEICKLLLSAGANIEQREQVTTNSRSINILMNSDRKQCIS